MLSGYFLKILTIVNLKVNIQSPNVLYNANVLLRHVPKEWNINGMQSHYKNNANGTIKNRIDFGIEGGTYVLSFRQKIWIRQNKIVPFFRFFPRVSLPSAATQNPVYKIMSCLCCHDTGSYMKSCNHLWSDICGQLASKTK